MNEEFSKLEKEKFARAKELSQNGDLEGVLETMQDLVRLNPESAVFSSVLANTLWELEELEKAENEFRRAVQLAPKSEKISLGLFHCLWDQNRTEDAFEEMKRFTQIADSDQYRAIVKDINQN